MSERLSYETSNRLYVRGRASKYIRSFDSLRRGDKVVLCCRKSTRDKNGSLQDQINHLRGAAERFGLIVVHEKYEDELSGWDPFWLAHAAAIAKQHGAVLLAECTNRFIRHFSYDPTVKWKARLQASDFELQDLAWWADGVPLVTHLYPDASPNEERAYQTRRRAAHKRGGRPSKPGYKKRIRLRLRKHAVQMRHDGKSLNQIARALNQPRSTVQDWTRSPN